MVKLFYCSASLIVALLNCSIVSSFGFAQDFGLREAMIIFLFSQI